MNKQSDVMLCNVHGTYFLAKNNVCPNCHDEWVPVDPEDLPDDTEIEQ